MLERIAKIITLSLFLILAYFSLNQANPNLQALNDTYTVCDSGCDYTTLREALNHPGLDQDTILLTEDYLFDYDAETNAQTQFSLWIPPEVTISCETNTNTFGDNSEDEIELSGSSNITIENCSFENTAISLFGNNVNLLNNTFDTENDNWIILTGVNGYQISNNSGITRLQLQGGSNGLIEQNDIECKFQSCVNVVTNGAPDYNSDPLDIDGNISINVLIQNNNIINTSTSLNEWIIVNGARDITFSNNIIRSDVEVDDIYMTLISTQNAEQVVYNNNYVISPDKPPNKNNASWIFNIRSQDFNVSAEFNNNTIIAQQNDACFGLFDNEINPNIPITIDINYNLCFQSSNEPSGTAISLQYTLATTNLTLTDNFNGFYNFFELIADTTDSYTSLNPNTVTSNPVFKIEDGDPSTDLELTPMSRYLDVDGTNDIGAYSASRTSEYTIGENCLVDYINCHSNLIETITHTVKSNDTITVLDGNYNALNLNTITSNITITGQSQNTILNANSTSPFAININNLSNSQISNLTLTNADTNISSYEMFSWAVSDGTLDYNEVESETPIGFILEDCSVLDIEPLVPPFQDVTNIPGIGSSNINLALLQIPGGIFTPDEIRLIIYIPNSEANSAAEFEANCGLPEIFINNFINDVFLLEPDGTYTFDNSTFINNNITILYGGDEPFINLNSQTGTGLTLSNSSNNNFENLYFENNTEHIKINSNSNNNFFTNIVFDQNAITDLIHNSSETNSFINTLFNFSKVTVNDGITDIYHTARVTVTDQSSGDPIENANINLESQNQLVSETETTDLNGQTPFMNLLASRVTSTDTPNATAGNLNPYKITTTATNYPEFTTNIQINQPNQEINISLATDGASSTTSTTSGSKPQTPTETEEPLRGSADTNLKWLEYLLNQKIIEGYSDLTIRPNQLINRAELTKIALLASKTEIDKLDNNLKNCFPDVQEEWFAPYVCKAKQLGWVIGYEDVGLFKPDQTTTEAEALKIILKSQNIPYENLETPNWYDTLYILAYPLNLTPTNIPYPNENISRLNSLRILFKAIVFTSYQLPFTTELEEKFLNENHQLSHKQIDKNFNIVLTAE